MSVLLQYYEAVCKKGKCNLLGCLSDDSLLCGRPGVARSIFQITDLLQSLSVLRFQQERFLGCSTNTNIFELTYVSSSDLLEY